MAKEPAPGRPFRCPAHVDDLLAVIPGNLGPAHRRRKIKGASVIKPVISRGLLNNGDIEIENDPTDDEEELGFYEQREYGHTYKLPELGIKLDFISQYASFSVSHNQSLTSKQSSAKYGRRIRPGSPHLAQASTPVQEKPRLECTQRPRKAGSAQPGRAGHVRTRIGRRDFTDSRFNGTFARSSILLSRFSALELHTCHDVISALVSNPDKINSVDLNDGNTNFGLSLTVSRPKLLLLW